jgi:hypothetical protein
LCSDPFENIEVKEEQEEYEAKFAVEIVGDIRTEIGTQQDEIKVEDEIKEEIKVDEEIKDEIKKSEYESSF